MTDDELLNYKARLEKEMSLQDIFQYSFKILLNSLYGALANIYCRYYIIRIAEGITLCGQRIIRYAKGRLNDFLEKSNLNDRVIYADTDSLYVTFSELVQQKGWDQLTIEETIDKLNEMSEQVIEPKLEEWYQELARHVGNPDNKIHMEREIISQRALWISKKRYVGMVNDDEGHRPETPELKVMGIEAVRSSTPSFCREKIKEAVRIALTGSQDDLMDFISKIRDEFMEQNMEDIAYPRGISDIRKYEDPDRIYAKGTPIHVRGSLMYNHLLHEKGLEHKYPKITNGDKIKFIHLRTPNPTREDVIAFSSKLPPEFGLEQYIDWNRQFEGAFKTPVQNIVKHVGWKMDGQTDLSQFFG